MTPSPTAGPTTAPLAPSAAAAPSAAVPTPAPSALSTTASQEDIERKAARKPKARPSKSTTVCKYFHLGTCRNGDACPYLHDKAERSERGASVSLLSEERPAGSDKKVAGLSAATADSKGDPKGGAAARKAAKAAAKVPMSERVGAGSNSRRSSDDELEADAPPASTSHAFPPLPGGSKPHYTKPPTPLVSLAAAPAAPALSPSAALSTHVTSSESRPLAEQQLTPSGGAPSGGASSGGAPSGGSPSGGAPSSEPALMKSWASKAKAPPPPAAALSSVSPPPDTSPHHVGVQPAAVAIPLMTAVATSPAGLSNRLPGAIIPGLTAPGTTPRGTEASKASDANSARSVQPAHQLSPTGSSSSSAASSLTPFLPPQPVRGLGNLGNTCYLNAVLQAVIATPGLRAHFVTAPPDFVTAPPDDPDAGGHAEGGITRAMRDFISQMHQPPATADALTSPPQLAPSPQELAFSPTELLTAVSARHGQYARRAEQDSHEMLRQLLDSIRAEELLRIGHTTVGERANEADHATKQADDAAAASADRPRKPPAEEPPTIVDELFAGQLRSTIVCLTCGSVSCSYEPFLDLSLPIPGTEDAPVTVWPAERPAAAKAAISAAKAAISADALNRSPPSGTRVSADDVLAKLPAEQRAAHKRLHLGACLQAFAAPEWLQGDDAYHCEKCAKAASVKKALPVTDYDADLDLSKKKKKKKPREVVEGEEPAAPPASAPPTSLAAAPSAPPPAAPKSGQPLPKSGQPALKWLQVCRKPAVLTLHLKRFRQLGGGRRTHKLDMHVPFPIELELSPFAASGPKLEATHFTQLPPPASDGTARYRLYGLVEHHGSFDGGHYVAFVRTDDGTWHKFDDSVVTPVDEPTVKAAQAFLLFYERFSAC